MVRFVFSGLKGRAERHRREIVSSLILTGITAGGKPSAALWFRAYRADEVDRFVPAAASFVRRDLRIRTERPRSIDASARRM